MSTTQLKTPDNADIIAAYQTSNDEVKQVLETLYGSEGFKPLKITDRVKTFEDACSIQPLSQNLDILLSYNGTDATFLAAQGFAQMAHIAKVLNEGWEPSWNNSNENKYYPWFKMNSGSGLSCSGYDFVLSYTSVGSRLVFKSAELATYAGNQFLDIYSKFLTI